MAMLVPRLMYACAYSAVLAAWLQLFFLRPLAREAIDMHERQLDPTQIIAVPYDIQRLAIYVAAVVCAVVLVAPGVSSSGDGGGQWRKFVQLVQLTAGCTALFVLCGASPYTNLWYTVLGAAHFATLCWFDAPIFTFSTTTNATTTASTITLRDVLRQRLRGRHGDFVSDAKQQQDVLAQTVLYSCVAFTVPMQILLLYDRGWQLQRWPVPVVFGSTIGWVVGTCLGTILATTTNSRLGRFTSKKQDEDTPGDSAAVPIARKY